jgi:protein-disulfide isomerase
MLQYLFDPAKEHSYGNPAGPIELTEYGDFQSELCAAVYPEIKKLQQALGNQLKFVFRHFPLSAQHPLAVDIAVVTEAASLQGKFWYMHDLFLEHQKDLTYSSLSKFAKEIGLDISSIKKSQSYSRLIQKVNNDVKSGKVNMVYETPTFFINGHRYTGHHDFEGLYKTCEFVLEFKRAA